MDEQSLAELLSSLDRVASKLESANERAIDTADKRNLQEQALRFACRLGCLEAETTTRARDIRMEIDICKARMECALATCDSDSTQKQRK